MQVLYNFPYDFAVPRGSKSFWVKPCVSLYGWNVKWMGPFSPWFLLQSV